MSDQDVVPSQDVPPPDLSALPNVVPNEETYNDVSSMQVRAKELMANDYIVIALYTDIKKNPVIWLGYGAFQKFNPLSQYRLSFADGADKTGDVDAIFPPPPVSNIPPFFTKTLPAPTRTGQLKLK